MSNICKTVFRLNNVILCNIERTPSKIASNVRMHHLSCYNLSANIPTSKLNSEKKSFEEVLPDLVNSLILSDPKFEEIPEIEIWIRKMFDYNLTGGKNIRGLTTVMIYEILEKPENISEESLKLVRVLGWCTEILQTFLLILDDMIDNSSSRRGKPCWFRLPNVGMSAINDGLFLYTSLFQIVKTHFENTPHYVQIRELYNETLWLTAMGQHLESIIPNRKDYNHFTMTNYNAIVTHKTSYYTYKLPIALGLLLVKNVDDQIYNTLEDICIEFGKLFQMEDDYIDCYGEESVTGKAGTDIQTGKCTWLAVTALQRCSVAQRAVFNACYGSKEPAHIERIKQLYEKLHVPELYREEERAIYDNIVNRTNNLSSNAMREFYLKLLDITYNRKL